MFISPFNFIFGFKIIMALLSIFLYLSLSSLYSIKWIFRKSGELSSALSSNIHYWERMYSLFTTNYLHRMSLPSVVLCVSSKPYAKMDGKQIPYEGLRETLRSLTHFPWVWRWNIFWLGILICVLFSWSCGSFTLCDLVFCVLALQILREKWTPNTSMLHLTRKEYLAIVNVCWGT